MLTPADVEQKTFSTALRGYDLDEVDDFLDEIVATIRELHEQLEEARAGAPAGEPDETLASEVPEPEVEVVEPEPEAPAAAPAGPQIDESAIGRALVAAQTAADRLLEEAESQAARIVDEAKSDADSWTEERAAKRREAEAEIGALAARVAAVRSELSVLADEVSGKLDEMDSVIDLSAPVPGTHGPESVATADTTDHDDSMDSAASVDSGDSPDDISGEHHYDLGEDEEGNETSDHLDRMLTGVATDLQLHSQDEEPPNHDQDSHDEEPDEDE